MQVNENFIAALFESLTHPGQCIQSNYSIFKKDKILKTTCTLYLIIQVFFY